MNISQSLVRCFLQMTITLSKIIYYSGIVCYRPGAINCTGAQHGDMQLKIMYCDAACQLEIALSFFGITSGVILLF